MSCAHVPSIEDFQWLYSNVASPPQSIPPMLQPFIRMKVVHITIISVVPHKVGDTWDTIIDYRWNEDNPDAIPVPQLGLNGLDETVRVILSHVLLFTTSLIKIPINHTTVPIFQVKV